jgi:carbohydrate-binding DOMON domain-containing protein
MFVYYTYTDITGVEGGHLDNIVVDDEPISPYAQTTTPEPTDTTTPSETPTGPGEPTPIDPMLLALAGAGVVIVILAVVCLKRR